MKLEIRGLQKVFTNNRRGNLLVLDGVDLEFASGEFVSIVGPSGCGKSTLLQLIAGLERLTSGHISVDGRSLNGPGLDRGIVFQEYALFPWQTVQKNVEFGPRVRGLTKKERRLISEKYIELTGLQGFESYYPGELSGGMRQRIALARALANEPEILLMDEPFAALDAQLREALQQEVLQIWEQTRKTIVFVTHQIEEAIFLAQRVVVMTARPGRVKEIVNLDLPRPRCRETRISPEFHKAESRIRKLVWEEVSGQDRSE
jgi:NitT/TauT family transport system ATP-binding protein